ncbi:ATP synthase F0 subunit B [Candidatus Kuenenbacteria bacterium RIFCSPHIGHO2_12_FULL_42_14]|nr:MAG: ATP synthase F0 subunit B [Candidatus Kuenenbacteria bacterium RIFCSPLOWO2_02_FULL_42_16]OGH00631.1 MAG: ATP synthase F0 subunit B [Candidatus Kuenenbacteria bacterium RIFCSPHIGHO2_12_FULL_42_14]
MFNHFIQIAQAAEEVSREAGSQSFTEILGIDGKLFAAQLVNFALVLFVLWRWVYRPLVKILNERSKKIEKSLKEAQEIEQRLANAKEEQAAILSGAKKEAAVILAKVESEATENNSRLVAEAEERINKQLAVARERLAEDRNKIVKEIKTETAAMIETALLKIIPARLDAETDKKVIKKFLEKDED